MIADLIDDVSAHALGKSAGILHDEKWFESGRARFIVPRLACARQDFDEIRRKCKTCPPLAARQYPFIAIPHCLRLYAGEVRAGGRFGKRDAADPFALRGSFHQLEPSVVVECLRAEALASRQDAADG